MLRPLSVYDTTVRGQAFQPLPPSQLPYHVEVDVVNSRDYRRASKKTGHAPHDVACHQVRVNQLDASATYIPGEPQKGGKIVGSSLV